MKISMLVATVQRAARALACHVPQGRRTARDIAATVVMVACALLPDTAIAQSCTAPPGGPPCAGSSVASAGGSGAPYSGAGNPINVITGNKYQREEDMPALPGVLGLEIVRHYNSAYGKPGYSNGSIGRGWRLSYETELFDKYGKIQILQADGRRVIFDRDPKTPGLCTTANPGNGAMALQRKPNGLYEYTWTWTDGRKLHFNSWGKLDRITAPTGESVQLLYDSLNVLVRVIDPQGRSLNLVYFDPKLPNHFHGVQFIDSPVGRFEYEYGSTLPKDSGLFDKAQLLANLVRVRLPTDFAPDKSAHALTSRGTTTSRISRIYHHEDPRSPWVMTGISVETIGSDNKLVKTRFSTYGYDGDARAILSTHAGNVGKVTLDTSESGKTVLTNSLGQKTTYLHAAIAGEYRLLEVRGAGCASCGETNVRYGYNDAGQLIESTKLTDTGTPTATTRTELDKRGRTVKVSKLAYQHGKPGPAQMQVRFEYQGEKFAPVVIARPSVVSGKEALTRIEYNYAGQPLSVTESGWTPAIDGAQAAARIERTTSYRYASINGRSVLTQIDGPLPNGKSNGPLDSDITRFEYDKRSNTPVASNAIAKSGALEEYDRRDGLLTRIIAPGRRTTDILERDEAGRPRRIRTPGDIELGYEFDPHGRVLRRHKAGITEYMSYNALGQLVRVQQSIGQTVNFAYDADGRVSDIFDAQNNRIRISRNTEGALLTRYLLNPDGSIAQQADLSQFADDPEAPANLAHTPDISGELSGPNGNGTQLVLGIQSLPETLLDPNNAATRFLYDKMRRLTSFTDARGIKSSYSYDDFGRLVRADSFDAGITVFRYDAADHLASKTTGYGTAEASTVQYHYDAAGRVIEQLSAEGKTTISYGQSGRPDKIVFPAGEEHYRYDGAARLTTHTRVIDGHRFTTSYAYDERGQLRQKKLPDGQVLLYRYHGAMHPKAGLLAGIARQDLFGQTVLLDGLNDADDSYAKQRYRLANGLDFVRELDRRGHIARIGSPGIWEENHRRDTAGQLVRRDPIGVAATRVGYAYDSRGRLTGLAGVGKNASARGYAYDAGGNMLAQLSGNALTRYRIAPAANRILATQTDDRRVPYFYNSAGSVTRIGDTSFTWNSQQRLSTVAHAGKPLAEYAYNAFGERIKKVTYANNQRTITYFFYDGHQLVAEAAPNAGSITITRQYVWLDDTGGARPIALLQARAHGSESLAGKALKAIPTGRTRAAAQANQTDIFAIVADHTGAPRALVDEGKRTIWRAGVVGYGEAIPNDGNLVTLNLRGSNQYFDQETKLHYNTRRYFDPASGRYLSADPIGLAGGSNPYAFAGNNPVDRIDPLGLQTKPAGAVSSWTFDEKLKYVVERVAEKYPGELGSALKELVSPTALATTGAIFGIWAAAQFTPYGWAADIAIAGIGYLLIGTAVWDVISGLYDSSSLIINAKCEKDLQEAGDILAKGFGSAVVAAGAGAAGVGASKVTKLIKLIFKDSATAQKAATAAAITESRFGKFIPGRTRSGNTANVEHLELHAGDYPPWSAMQVIDTWLNPGTKIYMVMERDAIRPGGWATPKQFTSLAEARKELALLEEFKPSGSNCCVLQEYIVKAPIPARQGQAGALTSRSNPNEIYPGGAAQWELLLDKSLKWSDFLTLGKKVNLI